MSRREFSSLMSSLREDQRIRFMDRDLGQEMSNKLIDASVLWASTLEPFFSDFQIRDPQGRNILIQWFYRLVKTDFYYLALFLKDVNTWWRNETLLPNQVPSFQSLCQRDFPRKERQIVEWTYPLQLFWLFNSDNEIALARFLNHFCNFITKVQVQDSRLSRQNLIEYMEVEKKISMHHVPFELCDDLNAIMREWLYSFSLQGGPRHGNGAVAEPKVRTKLEKYQSFQSDQRISFFSKRNDIVAQMVGDAPTGLVRRSRTIFVAKSMTSFRTISAEPATLQFLQQYVLQGVSDFLSSHPYLSRRIPLENQEVSRNVAQKGSLTGQYATIDLSSASDTVSWDLVKSIFKGTPLYEYLLYTRSTDTLLPNRKVVNLRKFAPMGSSLNFPVECLVFSSIVEYAARLTNLPYHKHWVVYGDDIICHHEISEKVMELLTLCGFSVNFSKTFTLPHIPFRESCGGEYYRGIDITPVRLPREFPGIRNVASSEFQTMVSLTNRLFDFSIARNLCLAPLLRDFKTSLLFSASGNIGIKSNNPTNFHLQRSKRTFSKNPLIKSTGEKGVITLQSLDIPIKTPVEAVSIRLLDWYCAAERRKSQSYTVRTSITGTNTVQRHTTTPLHELLREEGY